MEGGWWVSGTVESAFDVSCGSSIEGNTGDDLVSIAFCSACREGTFGTLFGGLFEDSGLISIPPDSKDASNFCLRASNSSFFARVRFVILLILADLTASNAANASSGEVSLVTSDSCMNSVLVVPAGRMPFSLNLLRILAPLRR